MMAESKQNLNSRARNEKIHLSCCQTKTNRGELIDFGRTHGRSSHGSTDPRPPSSLLAVTWKHAQISLIVFQRTSCLGSGDAMTSHQCKKFDQRIVWEWQVRNKKFQLKITINLIKN